MRIDAIVHIRYKVVILCLDVKSEIGPLVTTTDGAIRVNVLFAGEGDICFLHHHLGFMRLLNFLSNNFLIDLFSYLLKIVQVLSV